MTHLPKLIIKGIFGVLTYWHLGGSDPQFRVDYFRCPGGARGFHLVKITVPFFRKEMNTISSERR